MTHPAHLMPYESLIGALKEREEQGLVHSNRLDGHNITVWSYTRKCVYEKAWDTYTMLARGLILDEYAHCIVATPFPKFFNYGEMARDDVGVPTIPEGPFEIFEKMDGSLIILFFYKERWRCATKGSFQSIQARAAQAIIDATDMSDIRTDYTLLLELIGPDNRIVIKYPQTKLVLLGGYDDTGRELSRYTIGVVAMLLHFTWAPSHHFESFAALLAVQSFLPATSEGFVVRFENGYRLKVKGDAYCHIHRMIAGIRPLVIWKAMRDREDLDAMRQMIPEEFWTDFDSIRTILQGQLNYLTDHVKSVALMVADWSDKELGLRMKTLPEKVRHFLFPLRRQGSLTEDRKSRWRLFEDIRPSHNHLTGYRPSTSLWTVLEEEP